MFKVVPSVICFQPLCVVPFDQNEPENLLYQQFLNGEVLREDMLILTISSLIYKTKRNGRGKFGLTWLFSMIRLRRA